MRFVSVWSWVRSPQGACLDMRNGARGWNGEEGEQRRGEKHIHSLSPMPYRLKTFRFHKYEFHVFLIPPLPRCKNQTLQPNKNRAMEMQNCKSIGNPAIPSFNFICEFPLSDLINEHLENVNLALPAASYHCVTIRWIQCKPDLLWHVATDSLPFLRSASFQFVSLSFQAHEKPQHSILDGQHV